MAKPTTPLRRLLGPVNETLATALPDVVEGPVRRFFGMAPMPTPQRAAPSLAVPRAPLALPAPPKRLALPAPAPKLPSFAVKRKGGQWWADKPIGAIRQSDIGAKIGKLDDVGDHPWFVRPAEGGVRFYQTEDEARAAVQRLVDRENPNRSAENAARKIADASLRLAPDATGPLSQLQNWFLRAAPRYIKNEMGTPDDPMRALAERGALHVALSPDEWSDTASSVISRQPIGAMLGMDRLYTPTGADPRAGYDFGASLAVNMPWLKKAPVTDELYGIGDTHALQSTMGMNHLLDEMGNAMNPQSGLPIDLAVRPESLDRMGLAQAAEHVGKINQWRAKEMERAALDAENNPVTHVFKEYGEDNPMGLRWVEMAPPKGDGPTNYDVEEELGKALKYEGDTMGHCVGGYCPDVMEGRSRIFSLRDAKGEPHVTIETRPGRREGVYSLVAEMQRRMGRNHPDFDKAMLEPTDYAQANFPDLYDAYVNAPDEIIQIKGKQNRKPKDEYLPFVRDFVQSGNWGEIGDLDNADLVRFGGNLIPSHEYDKIINDAYSWMSNSPGGQAVGKFYDRFDHGTDAYREADRFVNNTSVPVGNSAYSLNEILSVLSDPGAWEPETVENILQGVEHLKANPVELPSVFNGFAVGGRVDADRCFCHNPLSVKRGR